MQDLRGVMADAECPRCNTTMPPPEGRLATCKTCGLVFTPHEIQHRGRPRAVVDDVEPKPLPDPPAGVRARREGKAIVITWPLARYVSLFFFSLGLLLAWFAVNRLVPLYHWFWAGVAFSATIGLLQLLGEHVITIEDDRVTHHIAFMLGRTRIDLQRVTSIEMRKGRLAMWELHLRAPVRSARTMLVRTIDQKPLAYAAAIIAEYLET
ncbi:MAG: hypothetical protein QM831_44325 [Kofleriaceae bacterium]